MTNARGSRSLTRRSPAAIFRRPERHCRSPQGASLIRPRAIQARARSISARDCTLRRCRELDAAAAIEAAPRLEQPVSDDWRAAPVRSSNTRRDHGIFTDGSTWSPTTPDAHHELGEIVLPPGPAHEALAEFTAALMLEPDARRRVRGDRSSASPGRQLRRGRGSARRAVALDASHKEARYVLATSLVRMGKRGRRQAGARDVSTTAVRGHRRSIAAARDRRTPTRRLSQHRQRRVRKGDGAAATRRANRDPRRRSRIWISASRFSRPGSRPKPSSSSPRP